MYVYMVYALCAGEVVRWPVAWLVLVGGLFCLGVVGWKLRTRGFWVLRDQSSRFTRSIQTRVESVESVMLIRP